MSLVPSLKVDFLNVRNWLSFIFVQKWEIVLTMLCFPVLMKLFVCGLHLSSKRNEITSSHKLLFWQTSTQNFQLLSKNKSRINKNSFTYLILEQQDFFYFHLHNLFLEEWLLPLIYFSIIKILIRARGKCHLGDFSPFRVSLLFMTSS